MNSDIRKLWANKTFELANIGAGALIFGQVFSAHAFSVLIAIIGILLVSLGYLLSFLLLRKRRR